MRVVPKAVNKSQKIRLTSKLPKENFSHIELTEATVLDPVTLVYSATKPS